MSRVCSNFIDCCKPAMLPRGSPTSAGPLKAFSPGFMGIPPVLLWATPAPQCQVQPLNTLSAAEPSAVTAARAASWVPPNAVLPASRHAEEAQRLAGAQAESRASRRIQVIAGARIMGTVYKTLHEPRPVVEPVLEVLGQPLHSHSQKS